MLALRLRALEVEMKHKNGKKDQLTEVSENQGGARVPPKLPQTLQPSSPRSLRGARSATMASAIASECRELHIVCSCHWRKKGPFSDEWNAVSAPEASAHEFQSGGVVDMLVKLEDEFSRFR